MSTAAGPVCVAFDYDSDVGYTVKIQAKFRFNLRIPRKFWGVAKLVRHGVLVPGSQVRVLSPQKFILTATKVGDSTGLCD